MRNGIWRILRKELRRKSYPHELSPMKSLSEKSVLFLLFAGILCGCTTFSTDFRKPNRDLWALLPGAKRADAKALHKAFATALRQVSMPYVNGGEYAEAMSEKFLAILRSTGDTAFAKALSSETSITRSAVREFFSAKEVKPDYPQTYAQLVVAPNIDWPSSTAYRRSWIDSGQTPPEKEIWR